MEDTLYYYLSTIDAEHKFIAFADVQLNSIENNVAELEMISGYGYNLVLGTYVPFEEDDDWIWGTLDGNALAGKCDGTMVGVSDGSNELEWRFNNPQCAPVNSGGYTNLETVYVIGGDPVNANGNYMVYVDFDYNWQACLLNEELTFYLTQGHDIIYEYDDPGTWWTEGRRPPGKDFIRIDINDESAGGIAYVHYYYITYGLPIGLPD